MGRAKVTENTLEQVQTSEFCDQSYNDRRMCGSSARMQEENFQRERANYYSNYFNQPKSSFYSQSGGGARSVYNDGGGAGDPYVYLSYHCL